MTYAPEPIMPVLVLDGTYATRITNDGISFTSSKFGDGVLGERFESVVWQWLRANHQWRRWEDLRAAWGRWAKGTIGQLVADHTVN